MLCWYFWGNEGSLCSVLQKPRWCHYLDGESMCSFMLLLLLLLLLYLSPTGANHTVKFRHFQTIILSIKWVNTLAPGEHYCMFSSEDQPCYWVRTWQSLICFTVWGCSWSSRSIYKVFREDQVSHKIDRWISLWIVSTESWCGYVKQREELFTL